MFQFLVGFMALSLLLIGSLISCCGPVAGRYLISKAHPVERNFIRWSIECVSY